MTQGDPSKVSHEGCSTACHPNEGLGRPWEIILLTNPFIPSVSPWVKPRCIAVILYANAPCLRNDERVCSETAYLMVLPPVEGTFCVPRLLYSSQVYHDNRRLGQWRVSFHRPWTIAQTPFIIQCLVFKLANNEILTTD